jgi:hypothetical protein
MSVNSLTNGKDVFNWKEFKNLLTKLKLPQCGKIESFVLMINMDLEILIINDVTVLNRKHNISDGIWHMKEYKDDLCSALGVVEIKRTRLEKLMIETDEAVQFECKYICSK